ncbi:MAG: DUF4105 domain-containing protein, partial [Alphaproteobacteria bacterium]|nr:DUF4105 domain-containing protein [Alphaproteobacteria bacterium]
SNEELELFVAHLWEMRRAKIRYYYASKNCSYVLLLMLEAAKPELELASKAGVYILPLETLKAVNGVLGLVKKATYRPSRQSKLKYRAAQMSKAQIEALRDIIREDKIELSLLSDAERADVLETAYQYEQYRYIEEGTALAAYRQKSFKLLKERSRQKQQAHYFDDLREGENPVSAHGAAQAGGSVGEKNGKFFEEVSFRPLYNSLLEDSYGLLRGAEISAFETKVRRYEKENKFVLDEFKLLGIKSLLATDVMFSPFSYDLEGGFKRVFDVKDKEEHMAFEVSLGGGKSYQLKQEIQVYIMGVPSAGYGGGLAENGYGAFGVRCGAYYQQDRVRLHFRATKNWATSYMKRGEVYEAEAGVGLTRRVMLYGRYKLFEGEAGNDEEVCLGVRVNW